MRRVVIIQARMASTRLPGKVLEDVCGQPMLARQLQRLQRCAAVDDIVVATTSGAADEPVVMVARAEGVRWFRGSEADVLDRYAGAAREAKADVVVRVTSDCPLIDPEVTDCVIREVTTHPETCDYASNVVRRTYPRGLDTEAFFQDTLIRLSRLALSRPAREHVTVFLRTERPDLFLVRSVTDSADNSDLRWTVDSEADLRMVRAVYEGLSLETRILPYREILAYLRARPELSRLNAGIETWSPA
jgi:spore coat polysaccharide biosynthesis protein SpsF